MTNKEADARYIHVEYKYLKRRDLTMTSKMLYYYIQGFWDGNCTASNDTVAQVLGCTSRSIQRAVAELKGRKLVLSTTVTKDGYIVGRTLRTVANAKQ